MGFRIPIYIDVNDAFQNGHRRTLDHRGGNYAEMGLRPDNLKNGSNGNTKIQAIQALIKCGLNNKNKDWTDPNSRSTIPSSWNDVENRLERHSQNTQFPLSGSVLEPIKEKTILSGAIRCTQQAGRQVAQKYLVGRFTCFNPRTKISVSGESFMSSQICLNKNVQCAFTKSV